jgi:hypothetical protein
MLQLYFFAWCMSTGTKIKFYYRWKFSELYHDLDLSTDVAPTAQNVHDKICAIARLTSNESQLELYEEHTGEMYCSGDKIAPFSKIIAKRLPAVVYPPYRVDLYYDI